MENKGGPEKMNLHLLRWGMKFLARWQVSHHRGAAAPEASNLFFFKKIIPTSSSFSPLSESKLVFFKTIFKTRRSTILFFEIFLKRNKQKLNEMEQMLPSVWIGEIRRDNTENFKSTSSGPDCLVRIPCWNGSVLVFTESGRNCSWGWVRIRVVLVEKNETWLLLESVWVFVLVFLIF